MPLEKELWGYREGRHRSKALWEFGESRGHLVAKIRNGFLEQVTFELDSEGSLKPSSLATEELKVITLLETSPAVASAEKARLLLVGSLEIDAHSLKDKIIHPTVLCA